MEMSEIDKHSSLLLKYVWYNKNVLQLWFCDEKKIVIDWKPKNENFDWILGCIVYITLCDWTVKTESSKL